MDFLERFMAQASDFSSPLSVVLGGVCLILGTCFMPMLQMRGKYRQIGPKCRPDKPLDGAPAQAKITSLRVYPIKSCAGHEVQQAVLADRGLEMDRLWLVIDGVGRFMSQRRCAKMALVSPSLPRTMDEPLILSAPGMASLEVPVMRKVGPGGPSAGGEVFQVEVWDSTCKAVDQGNAAAEWLGEFLGRDDLRLVRMQDGFVRPTDPGYGEGFSASFADGFPMLLAAEESLEELNSRMAAAGSETIGMERFRPNIVVRGWGPFAEDNWTKLRVSGISMRTPKPCSRCKVPGINQTTLEVLQEPRKTLNTFRAGSHVTPWKEKWAKDVFFGMNVLHESGGVLRVGDDVNVLRVASETSEKKSQ